jgi:DNA polymerase-3 subunit beta
MLKINLVEFQNAIEKITKVLPKKTSLVLDGVKILETVNLKTDSESQTFTLYVTDLTYLCKIKTKCNVLSDINVNLSFDSLKKGIKYFKNEVTLTLIQTDKEMKLSVTDGNKSLLIPCFPSELMVDIKNYNEQNTNNHYVTDLQKFNTRIDKVSCSIAKDETRPILQGVHFNQNDIVTIDGYRISINTDPTLTFNEKINVPYTSLALMQKLISKKDKVELTVKENKLYTTFEFCDVVFATRNLEGEFPNYKQILSMSDREDYFTSDYQGIKESVKYIYDMRTNEKLPIVFETKENDLHIVLEEAGNRFTSRNNIKHKTNDVRIAFNPQYILDAINSLDQDDLIFNLSINNASINPLIISTKNQNEKYLVLPVRC